MSESSPGNARPTPGAFAAREARAALAQSEKEKGLFFKPLFDLPENPKSEIIDTKLTYRKALAALEAYQKKQPAKTKSDKRVLYQKSSKKEK